MFSIFREYFWPRKPQPREFKYDTGISEILFALADFNDDNVHAVFTDIKCGLPGGDNCEIQLYLNSFSP